MGESGSAWEGVVCGCARRPGRHRHPARVARKWVAAPELPIVHRGIPLGPPKLPEDLYGGLFTGTKLTLTLTPTSTVADLNDAARGRCAFS
jgi:hypothetical protein